MRSVVSWTLSKFVFIEMATLSRSCQLLVAAVLIVATFVSIVESSRNTRPYARPRGSSRHLGNSRYGTEGRRRSQDPFRTPGFIPNPAPELPSATRVKNAGNWFQNFIASKHASNNPPNSGPDHSTDHGAGDQEKVVVRPPIIKSGSVVTSPTITMIFLETIDARKRNSSRFQQPSQPERAQEEEEVVTNEATTLPSNPRPSRRAFTADERRIQCGGPNEAGLTDECYRFELPADLNNNATVISGAVVLLPAGNRFPVPRQRTVHHNVTIVAKFPTSGEYAYRESISVQNISYDIPWKWKSASLPQGSSLVSRALQEDNTLLLKLSVISNDNGQPTTSNFIPMESNMLPVLVVDIEFNGTDSSTTSSTTTTATLRTTQANVLERQLRKRRTVLRTTEDILPNNTVTCSGYPGCCRRTMDISFSDLGWTWMVAPRRLTTSVCIGSCRAPSMTFESFMVNLMQGHGRPSSRDERRCRPSRTHHFDALVINEDGDIQMMRLPDFIVRECACAENQRETKVPPAAPTYEGKHV